jgi:hypothetical protein
LNPLTCRLGIEFYFCKHIVNCHYDKLVDQKHDAYCVTFTLYDPHNDTDAFSLPNAIFHVFNNADSDVVIEFHIFVHAVTITECKSEYDGVANNDHDHPDTVDVCHANSTIQDDVSGKCQSAKQDPRGSYIASFARYF